MRCVLVEAARKRADVLGAGLETGWVRRLWSAFTDWMLRPGAPVNRASKRLVDSHPYFMQLEQNFAGPDDLTACSLHERIPSAAHRTNLLAFEFVVNQMGLGGSKAHREHFAELQRIEDILARARGQAYESILQSYRQALEGEGKSPRTARLYLGVAQSFAARSGLRSDRPCRQDRLDEFFQSSPGSLASLSRFVRFGNEHSGWDVRLPKKGSLKLLRAKALKAKRSLQAAIDLARSRPPEQLGLLDVSRILSAATGLPQKQLSGKLSAAGLLHEDGTVELDPQAQIHAGHPLYPYAVRWRDLVALREAGRRVPG